MHYSQPQSSEHQLRKYILERMLNVSESCKIDAKTVLVTHGGPICHMTVDLQRLDFLVLISCLDSHVVSSI